MRPLLLDLFCGAGGASEGYRRAGFQVIGVDLNYKLCGCMFGLPGLRRERWFETSWHGFDMRSPCHHVDATITVAGHPGGSSTRDGSRGYGDTAAWREAMGIDWMTAKELAQAIPPAYTEYIGAQLLEHVRTAA